FIQRQGPAGRHGAVMATARTDVAEDQKSGRPAVPALPDIRAPRLFADRMEVQVLGKPPDFLVVRPLAQFHLEPCRQARPRLLEHGDGTAHVDLPPTLTLPLEGGGMGGGAPFPA